MRDRLTTKLAAFHLSPCNYRDKYSDIWEISYRVRKDLTQLDRRGIMEVEGQFYEGFEKEGKMNKVIVYNPKENKNGRT